MELRRYNSTKLHLTMKAKRSTDDEDLCEKFVFNEEHEKSFYSPGYPSTYVKNITCTRVLQGKNIFSVHCSSQKFAEGNIK